MDEEAQRDATRVHKLDCYNHLRNIFLKEMSSAQAKYVADELKPDMDSQLRMMNSMGELQDARSTIFGLKKYDDFKLENP